MDAEYTFSYPEELEKAMLQLADTPELYADMLELLEKATKVVVPPFPEGFEKDPRWKSGDDARHLWANLPDGCIKKDHPYHWLWTERKNHSGVNNAKIAQDKADAKAEAEKQAAEGKGWAGETDWQKVNPHDPTVDWSKVPLPFGAQAESHPAHAHWMAKRANSMAKNEATKQAGTGSTPKPSYSNPADDAFAILTGNAPSKPADAPAPGADNPADTPAPSSKKRSKAADEAFAALTGGSSEPEASKTPDTPEPEASKPTDTPAPSPAPSSKKKSKAADDAFAILSGKTPDSDSTASPADTGSAPASSDGDSKDKSWTSHEAQMKAAFDAKVKSGEINEDFLSGHKSEGFTGAPVYMKKKIMCKDGKMRTYRVRVNKDEPGVENRTEAATTSDVTSLGSMSEDDFAMHAISGHENDDPNLNALFLAMMEADDKATAAEFDSKGISRDTSDDSSADSGDISSDIQASMADLLGDDFDASDFEGTAGETPDAKDNADTETSSERVEQINSFVADAAKKVASQYDNKEEFSNALADSISKEVYADEPDDASDNKVHPDEYTEGEAYDASKDTRYDNTSSAPEPASEPEADGESETPTDESDNSDDAYSDVKTTDVNGNVKKDTDWGNDKKLAEAKDDTEDDNQDLDSASSYDTHAAAEKNEASREDDEAGMYTAANKSDISAEKAKVDKLRKIADDITGISAAFKNKIGNWVAGLATLNGVDTGMSSVVAKIRSKTVPTLAGGLEGFTGEATKSGLQFTIPVDPLDKNATESVTIPWKDFDADDPADTAVQGLQQLIKKKIAYFKKYENQ